MEQLNERIRLLRKEKGLTQIQLAEKLFVTDKAVSKWEVGESQPEIQLIPKIAALFGVTIDYLLTGREPEKEVSIMSQIELSAKNDDPSLLSGINYTALNMNDGTGNTLFDYIKKYSSKKVLAAIIDSCNGSYQFEKVLPISRKYFVSEALCLLIQSNRERIYFSNIFDVEIRYYDPAKKNIISSTARDLMVRIEGDFKKVIECLVEEGNVTEEQLNYYFDLSGTGMLNKQSCWSYMYSQAIQLSAKSNIQLCLKLLRRAGESNKLYLAEVEKINKEYPRKDINYKFWNDRALEKLNKSNFLVGTKIDFVAMSLVDYEAAIEANKLVGNDEILRDIEVKKMEESKEQNFIEYALHATTFNSLLSLEKSRNLFLFDKNKDAKELLKDLQAMLLKIKQFKLEVVDCGYIHYYEMIEDLIDKKEYKKLFAFAVDNELKILSDVILMKNDEKIKKIARNLFTSNDSIPSDRRNHYSIVVYKTAQLFERYRYSEKYRSMLRNQFSNLTNEQLTSEIENYKEACKKTKDDYFNKIIQEVEEEITNIKIRGSYDGVASTLTEEYLLIRLDKGEVRSVVIDLCVKLEAVLKHKFHLEGDLLEMLNQLKGLQKTMGENDGWGYNVSRDVNPFESSIIADLHKLRQLRNNYVHAEKENVDFTVDDIKRCIKIVSQLEKGVQK